MQSLRAQSDSCKAAAGIQTTDIDYSILVGRRGRGSRPVNKCCARAGLAQPVTAASATQNLGVASWPHGFRSHEHSALKSSGRYRRPGRPDSRADKQPDHRHRHAGSGHSGSLARPITSLAQGSSSRPRFGRRSADGQARLATCVRRLLPTWRTSLDALALSQEPSSRPHLQEPSCQAQLG